MTSWNSR